MWAAREIRVPLGAGLCYNRPCERPLLGDLALASLDTHSHLAPAEQPTSVRELTERLFPAYTIDGGSIHLAGCRLEDRLFLEIDDVGLGSAEPLFIDASGRAIESTLARELGMDRTVPWSPPPEMPPAQLLQLIDSSTAAAREHCGVSGSLDARFIWCKYAQGKLRITVGDESSDLAFSGWTRTLEAPPFLCPLTKTATYHIAATDDGRIAAAEQIALCSETGQRVLIRELVTCDATAELVLPKLTQTCPVTGQPVIEHSMVTCSMCGEAVSPKCVSAGRCQACRSLKPIARDSQPLARLRADHEVLAGWPKWSGAETSSVHILVGTGWWRRLLLVVDKRQGTPRHVALGKRFSNRFTTTTLEELAARK